MSKNEEAEKLPDVLTTAEVAKLLRVSRNSIKKLVEEGRLPKPFIAGERSRRWRKAAVLDAIGG